MLGHMASVQQIYNKTRFTKNCTKKLREMYDKVWTKL